MNINSDEIQKRYQTNVIFSGSFYGAFGCLIHKAIDDVTNIILFTSANAKITGADPGGLKFRNNSRKLKKIWSIAGERGTVMNAMKYSLKIFVIDQRNS